MQGEVTDVLQWKRRRRRRAVAARECGVGENGGSEGAAEGHRCKFAPVTILVEAAVESVDAALAAAEGGAHRVELCTDLAHGGTTPDVELLRACWSQLAIPIFVLVRPRAGDFVYTAPEHQIMIDQIQ